MSQPILELPAAIRSLFWECAEGAVTWEEHRDAIVERVLSRGDWDSIVWVRRQAGDDVLREVLTRTRGRSLTPPQVRLWQLLLDLRESDVSAWLQSESRRIWDRRFA